MSSISANGQNQIIYIQQSGSNIIYKINDSSFTTINTFPVTIINTNTSFNLKVYFTENITISTNTRYFICGSNNIQFGKESLESNGSVIIFTINTGSTYSGLIQNGTSTSNGFDNIKIFNIGVISSTTSLTSLNGWIAQQFFSKGVLSNTNYIMNCYSTGAISGQSGGIVGANSIDNDGILNIIGCYSEGQIGSGTATSAGGIIGALSNSAGSGILNIQECYSTGIIAGSFCGGIIGRYAGFNGNTVNINNCYSTGTLSGTSSGGIFGGNAGDTSSSSGGAFAINCYSTGNLTIGSVGGIFGNFAGNNSGIARATNCYTLGNISGTNTGGIFGNNNSATALAINCYTSGTANSGATKNGIYAGSSSDNSKGSGNYSEANSNLSGWNTTNVLTTLTGTPSSGTSYSVGTTWSNVSNTLNTPFELSDFGFNPYSLNNITQSGTTYSLNKLFSQKLLAGKNSKSSVLSGNTFLILSINDLSPSNFEFISINSSNGIISTNNNSLNGVYNIVIRNFNIQYDITNFVLTLQKKNKKPKKGKKVIKQKIFCSKNKKQTYVVTFYGDGTKKVQIYEKKNDTSDCFKLVSSKRVKI
jgi:hypothetical protein